MFSSPKFYSYIIYINKRQWLSARVDGCVCVVRVSGLQPSLYHTRDFKFDAYRYR